MIAGETFHQHAGEIDLAQHVHVLVGNEGVFKNDNDFLAAVIRVAHVHLAGFQLAGVAGLTAIDVKDAGVIGGDGEGHGIVPVFRAHGLRGHDEDLMGVEGAGLVHLGAAHHDAVLAAFHHAQEHVGILLGVGREATVALGVGHGTVHSPVLFLPFFDEFHETPVVFGAVAGIDLVGSAEHGVEGVHAHAALEAGTGHAPAKPLHLHLVHQIGRGLVQMAEAVHGLAGKAGGRHHQLTVFGHLGQLVGHGAAVDGRADQGVVDAILDLLAKGINSAGAQITEGLDVLLGGHHNAYPDGLRDRFRNSGGRSMKTGPRDRSPHTLGQLLWQKLQPPSDWHMGMSSMSHTSIWAGRFTDHHTDSAMFSGVRGSKFS